MNSIESFKKKIAEETKMKTTWILEKREATFTATELSDLRYRGIENLFEIEGLPCEEIKRFDKKAWALETLKGKWACPGVYNKISSNGILTGFTEYVVEECEVDENGDFVEGSDYYTTPNFVDEYGYHYVANEGEESSTFYHSKMWYVMTDDLVEDLGNGYYDKATAFRVAGRSRSAYYTMVSELRIPVEYGGDYDWVCTDVFRKGKDFYPVEQIVEALADENNLPSFEEYNYSFYVRYYFRSFAVFTIDVNVDEYDNYIDYDSTEYKSWWDDPDVDSSAVYEIKSPGNALFDAICAAFTDQINTTCADFDNGYNFEF